MLSACIHPCLRRHFLPQKGQEIGDGLDCNLPLCPSQNNSFNNLAFPLRSSVTTHCVTWTPNKEFAHIQNGKDETTDSNCLQRRRNTQEVATESFGRCYLDALFLSTFLATPLLFSCVWWMDGLLYHISNTYIVLSAFTGSGPRKLNLSGVFFSLPVLFFPSNSLPHHFFYRVCLRVCD